MKKLKLQLDELTVESFDTAQVEERAGTVRAHDSHESDCGCGTLWITCPYCTYNWEHTCNGTRYDTCECYTFDTTPQCC